MPICLDEQKQECEKMNGGSEPAKVIRVCFVCTGNTCRSPMAAAVANAMAKKYEKILRQKNLPMIEAISAGLYANDGEPISRHAREALEMSDIQPVKGMDYRSHTAHTVHTVDVQTSDLLIGLGGGHCMELMMRFPEVAQKIVGMPEPISDPYGGNLEVYRECLSQIADGVRRLLFSSLPEEEREVRNDG